MEEELPAGVELPPAEVPEPAVMVVPVEVFCFKFPLPDTPGPPSLLLLEEAEPPDGPVMLFPDAVVLLLFAPEFAFAFPFAAFCAAVPS